MIEVRAAMSGMHEQNRKYTVDEFFAMYDRGEVEERTELIDGVVSEMSPDYRPHGLLCPHLAALLLKQIDRSSLCVAAPVSVICGEFAVPTPDVVVMYKDASGKLVPLASDMLLVIEIAYSTLGRDRGLKAPLYAAAGIPEYWVVNVKAGTFEVYLKSAPVEREYAPPVTKVAGDFIIPKLLPSVTINVSEVFAVLE